MSDKKILDLKQKIVNYCVQNKIFGSLRITYKDNILLEMYIGEADKEKHIPFSRQSMFSFYSLSKPFLVIGFLRLVDEGLVELDSHPSRYLDEACGFDTKVTLRQMLRHESGLPEFEFLPEISEIFAHGYPRFAREGVRALAKHPQAFAPGTQMQYANINMMLPALIIENLTGLSYADYMKERVFVPLGMPYAVVDDETLFIRERVQGYALLDGEAHAVEKSHDWLLGAGDMVGTVDDVFALARAIKHRLLLKEETWQQVLTPSTISPFGMGCTVSEWHGKKRITHNGGHTGFRTLHIYLPDEDFDIIFLSNSGYGNARADISEMIFQTFFSSDDTLTVQPEMDKGYI